MGAMRTNGHHRMHKSFFLAALLLMLCNTAKADYTVDFVRIACIRDAQFLDVEYLGVHNPAITTLGGRSGTARAEIMSRHGFFDPSNLSYECSLPDSKYKIVATYPPTCGALSDIVLSLYKDDELLIDHVVFGTSCTDRASVTRITIEDGKEGWYEREAEVCLESGTHENHHKCLYLFSDSHGFDKFPIRQGDIQTLLYLAE
jgi:hypothetical protein